MSKSSASLLSEMQLPEKMLDHTSPCILNIVVVRVQMCTLLLIEEGGFDRKQLHACFKLCYLKRGRYTQVWLLHACWHHVEKSTKTHLANKNFTPSGPSLKVAIFPA